MVGRGETEGESRLKTISQAKQEVNSDLVAGRDHDVYDHDVARIGGTSILDR